MEQPLVSGIDSISDEILLFVFQTLPTEDILRLSCVNKRFFRVAQDQCLHRNVDFGRSGENLFVSTKILHAYVSNHSSHLKSLALVDCYWIPPYQFGRILKPCQNIEEIDLIGCDVSLPTLGSLFRKNPNLTKLGWSIPQKGIYNALYGSDKQPTDLHLHLSEAFGKLSSLKLRFHKFILFETIFGFFPNNMKLSELLLEYKGQKATSLIHAGSDYSIHIKSKCPFLVTSGTQMHLNDISLHFNLNVIEFATNVAFDAAMKDQLLCLNASGSLNAICWDRIALVGKSQTIEKVDMSSSCLTVEKIGWITNLQHLTHLNLQYVKHCKDNLVKFLALRCKNLKSLNMNNCLDFTNGDLSGFEALFSSCTKLEHLNIGRSCFHQKVPNQQNGICKLIAKIRQLKSLSISPCCFVKMPDVRSANSSKEVKVKAILGCSSHEASDGVAVDEVEACSMTTLSGYGTRQATQQKEFNVRVIQNGSGLDELVEGLDRMEELELIGIGYTSVFSTPDEANGMSFSCPLTRKVLDAMLLPLKRWAALRKLTIAGLNGLGCFNSLVEITKFCHNLEYLSLADIGLPGNAMALSSLPLALKNCKVLRKLRVDQPHYNQTDKVMMSLQSCPRLESVLIVCKNGRIPIDTQPYTQLFEACKRLCVFQIFSGTPIVHCKRLTKELIKRYQNLRPPLSIAILQFSQSLTGNGLQCIPFAHLKTLTCFESKVAT